MPAARGCRVRPGVATRDLRPEVYRDPLPDATTQTGIHQVIAAMNEPELEFMARATVTPCAPPVAIVLQPSSGDEP